MTSLAINLPNQQIPAHLWHYTTIDGAVGIIKTQTLFATRLRYLSDLKEFHFATEFLLEDMFYRADKARWMGASEEIIPDLRDAFERIGKNICVVSFCGERDLLSQWRAYGRGQRGIALEFDPGRLIATAQVSRFTLIKCAYEYEEQRSILFNGLRDYVARFNDLPSDPVERKSRREAIAWDIAAALTYLAPYLKHKGFSEEKEYRLIGGREGVKLKWDVRRVGDMLATHCVLPIKADGIDSPLAGLIVGPPNAGWQDVADSLGVVRREQGLRGTMPFHMAPSGVPYRGAG